VSNEAAERLRRMMRMSQIPMSRLDDALADERKASVERIRAAVGIIPEYTGDSFLILQAMTRLLQALDAEAQR
jgi:hypothetical protein